MSRSGLSESQLRFLSLPLALYRVQCTSDLASGSWTILRDNVQGTGDVLQITDPGALDAQAARFYRVLMPPSGALPLAICYRRLAGVAVRPATFSAYGNSKTR
jgi:hypothetical protein